VLGLLPRTYYPPHDANRMAREGDVARARADFITGGSRNLRALLRNRFAWMNDFIRPDQIVVELGCGAGLTQFFLDHPRILATDLRPYGWVSACVDALHLPFAPGSVDVFICANMIHHVASPARFLDTILACLRPGGVLLIREPTPSFLLLCLLRVMRHEGWSLDVDVFDPDALANDPADAWSGNNAVSLLLFQDKQRFARRFPEFQIEFDMFSECLMFPLSGGVTAKTWSLELPDRVLGMVQRLDAVLCRCAPSVFAMGRNVALRKRMA
jgi:SAM-dependent methyltransferase